MFSYYYYYNHHLLFSQVLFFIIVISVYYHGNSASCCCCEASSSSSFSSLKLSPQPLRKQQKRRSKGLAFISSGNVVTTNGNNGNDNDKFCQRIINTNNNALKLSSSSSSSSSSLSLLFSSDGNNNEIDVQSQVGQPTELPDSLEDAALIASQCAYNYATQNGLGPNLRCRIDFDTSGGDETYTILKSSTEFMQKFTSNLCYLLIPTLKEWKENSMTQVVNARVELMEIMKQEQEEKEEEKEKEKAKELKGEEEEEEEKKDAHEEEREGGGGDGGVTEAEKKTMMMSREEKKNELEEIIACGGMTKPWEGDIARIYFPDEGSAALARRDWKLNQVDSLVPPCVQFSSLGGIQNSDTSNDVLTLFFCPRASESKYVEEVLYKSEENSGKSVMSIFINPNLVDMGVTGYGTAGRMLRERLIDGLEYVYYLRTLTWGALTRSWPRDYTVWQEDESVEEGGYKLIKRLDRLPSNPEVEDIYDIANGLQEENKDGFGFLNALGDFVNGMTRL